MMNAIKVLHITPHLGGGVGRVLSSVAVARHQSGSLIQETFICLEPLEKRHYVDLLNQNDIPVIIATEKQKWDTLLAEADIIQLEWWNHPLMAEWMSRQTNLHGRLVIWSHTSGLHFPAIPKALVQLPHAFLFTTPLSHPCAPDQEENLVEVVHSSGGFDDFPLVNRCSSTGPLRHGYLGSLNFAKLHPEIREYLKAVDLEDFAVQFFGDPDSNPALVQSAQTGNDSERVVIRQFTQRPDLAFQEMDVLIYLLNPSHYGTTENAILEAMACGVVPIVLDNPVEGTIVRHGITGLVVKDQKEFKDAVEFLQHNPLERMRMSQAAVEDIRSRFALEVTEHKMTDCYQRVMQTPKREINLAKVTGDSPAQWFLSCAGRYAACFSHDATEPKTTTPPMTYPLFMYERTKSSVFHFLKYFPDDPLLQRWAKQLKEAADTPLSQPDTPP